MRDGHGQNLREHLIQTAVRLIAERGTAGLAVRDIAREAQVADGVLYNYFEDKEDLLARALLRHVGNVMHDSPRMPEPGSGTLAENLRSFIDAGLATLLRLTPVFAGLLSQPKALARFHAMVGGDTAFGAAGEPGTEGHHADDGERRGLPDLLTAYLRAEQRIGRIKASADVEAASTLVVGAMHGQILPRVFFSPPGAAITVPAGLSARLAETILTGIASP